MKSIAKTYIPERKIDFILGSERAHFGYEAFNLKDTIQFSTDALESYSFSRWSPLVFGAIVVAAAIELGDRIVKRPSHGWRRNISLRIPVHDPDLWNSIEIRNSLFDAISFLTGDQWQISFKERIVSAASPQQEPLDFDFKASKVLAYSDGMDSLAVSGIIAHEVGQGLIRVRVGSCRSQGRRKNEAFAAVPYQIRIPGKDKEASARNRGFKFAMISAVAAYLSDAEEIVIPESGQGSIGPALISVGHAYPDYRNHPLFTTRMETFVSTLFGRRFNYAFPRLWHTKGETLREYVALTGHDDWRFTKSCWRSSQWSSVNGRRRQCGVCAACMLRRLSIHAADLNDDRENYICEDLGAENLSTAVAANFTKVGSAYNQYAIAGVLHLDHLAEMRSPMMQPVVERHARLFSSALGLTAGEASSKLATLLERHALEWKRYLDFLGTRSFIRKWARTIS